LGSFVDQTAAHCHSSLGPAPCRPLSSADRLAEPGAGLPTHTQRGHGQCASALSSCLGTGTTGRARRIARPLRVLLHRTEADAARAHGTEPHLLSWLAVGGSTDGTDAHCSNQACSAL